MKDDVVIIGAGSAGTALAARLSEDQGRLVLLLEAGPDYQEFDRDRGRPTSAGSVVSGWPPRPVLLTTGILSSWRRSGA
jgi:choline dehydrogenase-like flavoprotein